MLKKLCFYITLLSSSGLLAQDAIFTQFYAAPTMLNPAFTGSTGGLRLGSGYRNQWLGISSNLNTVYATADNWFEGIRSGIGLQVIHQSEELGEYSLSQFQASYALHLQITDDISLFPGIGFGYSINQINSAGLFFEDEIDIGSGLINPGSQDPVLTNLIQGSFGYFDFSAGAVLYAENYWLGAGIKHVNQPNISFLEGEDLSLQPLITFQGGYRKSWHRNQLYGSDPTSFLFITFNGYHQALYNRFDVGLEYGFSRLTLGILASNTLDKILESSDYFLSVNPNIGLKTKSFKIGLSYDIPVSAIGNVGNTFEVTLQFFSPSTYVRKRMWQTKY
ncbi:PorP/SprF family type IX secretion system membrane protein [Namhaeicola litoreus]|uniref:PorP/SprF family type IX secretion system membrane protein n=1 Tax=Namhaeicola litoreus TaxID=1052145 RepID=A0ABW3XYZ1_9FLAO